MYTCTVYLSDISRHVYGSLQDHLTIIRTNADYIILKSVLAGKRRVNVSW